MTADSVGAGVIYDTLQADKNRHYLRAGVGAFDLVDDEDQAVEGRLEYSPAWSVYRFRPVIGAAATNDGGAIFHASSAHDFVLPYEHVYVWFETGPALYFDGDGKDLGSNPVLRSGFEVGLPHRGRLAARWRGVAFWFRVFKLSASECRETFGAISERATKTLEWWYGREVASRN